MALPTEPQAARGDRPVLLGRIVGAHGIKGQLQLQSWTDPPEAILGYRPWLLCHNGSERTVTSFRSRMTDKGLLISLPDIEDRTQAEALKGAEVRVLRSQLPPPAPGEYYWVDLEGLLVRTVDGVELGRVERVLPTGANDVLEVHGDRLRFLPFVIGEYVKSVDIENGLIVIDWDPEF